MSLFGMQSHGGFCCGVTNVYLGSNLYPEAVLPPRRKFDFADMAKTGRAVYGFVPPGDTLNGVKSTVKEIQYTTLYSPANLCDVDRPEETAGSRLDFMTDRYLKNDRGGGILEIAITGSQRVGWNDFLIERGWLEVGSANNSNTSKMIHIYLLLYENGRVLHTGKRPKEGSFVPADKVKAKVKAA